MKCGTKRRKKNRDSGSPQGENRQHPGGIKRGEMQKWKLLVQVVKTRKEEKTQERRKI